MNFICKTEDDYLEVLNQVFNYFDSISKNNTASVIGLYGDLGSGKTNFTKILAKNIGVKKEITSPTFIIQRNFDLNEISENNIFEQLTTKFKKIYHFDVYRIESLNELKTIGWDEVISNPENLVVIEWANLIEQVLPNETLKIKFSVVDEDTRKLEIIFPNQK